MARRCTVVFENTYLGPSAVLMYRGASINAVSYPTGYTLDAKAKAYTRKLLMRGCAELARLHDKYRRRR